MLLIVCLGCLERVDETKTVKSAYGHGRICPPCEARENTEGDFIGRLEPVELDEV